MVNFQVAVDKYRTLFLSLNIGVFCVFIDLKIRKRIMLHHFYCNVGKTAYTIFSYVYTEEKTWLPLCILMHWNILAGIGG